MTNIFVFISSSSAAVSCGHPGNISHASLVHNGFTFTNIAQYSCPVGFDLQGASVLACLANRSWNDTSPSCIPRHCPTPNNTNQHRSSSTNHTVSSTTTFQCDTGYESNNSLSVYCHYNQSWSSIFPTCTPVKCAKLLSNVSVIISQPSSPYFGGPMLNSSCAAGYAYASGSLMRQCLADRTWSGADLLCKRIKCASLTAPANGVLNSTFGLEYESTVSYACNSGYYLSGSLASTLTCLDTAMWSASPPTCASKCSVELLTDKLLVVSRKNTQAHSADTDKGDYHVDVEFFLCFGTL